MEILSQSTILDIIVYRLGGPWGAGNLRATCKAMRKAIDPPEKFLWADSLLDRAARARHVECCEVAIQNGATNIRQVGYYALKHNARELLPLIISCARWETRKDTIGKLIGEAARDNKMSMCLDMMKLVYPVTELSGGHFSTALYHILLNGDAEIKTLFLSKFAPNYSNAFKNVLWQAMRMSKLDICKWVCEHGKDIEITHDMVEYSRECSPEVYGWLLAEFERREPEKKKQKLFD